MTATKIVRVLVRELPFISGHFNWNSISEYYIFTKAFYTNVVKKKLVLISAENFKKRHGITRLFFNFGLRGIFNTRIMGQNFSIWHLEIKK